MTETPDWSALCHEYDRMLDQALRANKRLFAVALFASVMAFAWLVLALCLI